MTDLHPFAHEALQAWAPFAMAAAILGAGALAVALVLARAAATRLSARSRYMLLSIALIAPVAGAFLVPAGVAGWVGGFAWPAEAPVTAGSTGAQLAFTSAPAASAAFDPLCAAAAVWLGTFLLLVAWKSGEWTMWRRIARRAAPLDDARVASIFRAVWGVRGAPPEVRLSRECDEPMVVGFARPVVLLPAGYGSAMDDAEIETVAVHELEHVRRRDNLDAALIDLLASLFWFDPFRWLARRRLLALREGACDERVLERGLPAESYLSALAKTSHAAVESAAVACMSGFRIRERMESIMTYAHRSSKWIPESLVRGAALAVLAIVALAIAGFAPVRAGDAASKGKHRLEVRLSPASDGQVTIVAEVRTPEGELVSAPRAMAHAGAPVEMTTMTEGRTYRLTVTPAADGSGLAKLDVLDGKKLIDSVVLSIERSTGGPAPEKLRTLPPPPPGYERVGEGVTMPKIVTRIDPTYPEDARKERVQGTVVVEARIGEDGVIRDVAILESLAPSLDQAAADAVRQWTFEPAMKEGRPVAVVFAVTIKFKLDSGEKH